MENYEGDIGDKNNKGMDKVYYNSTILVYNVMKIELLSKLEKRLSGWIIGSKSSLLEIEMWCHN